MYYYIFICLFVLILRYIFYIIYNKFLYIYYFSLTVSTFYKKYKLRKLLVTKQTLNKNDISNYLELI